MLRWRPSKPSTCCAPCEADQRRRAARWEPSRWHHLVGRPRHGGHRCLSDSPGHLRDWQQRDPLRRGPPAGVAWPAHACARYPVAIAETEWQDTWQRSQLGIAAVSSSARVIQEIMDDAERFVWSFPDIEVTEVRRHWLEED
ncbi:MAG: DUF503 family protein [Actinobacteria bacterium]|nr:DUF503 family protein [Actinomycetota bacterium]MSY71336.1 DUF503 family protein [Actinomycetota bacterium]